MLAADKLQLQSALKQQATALKEKEFNLHHSNFMTVGTQAAVLAGLDITMFIEFNPPDDSTWQMEHLWICRLLKAIYYGIVISAFCANMIVVSQTTVLSVLGAGLALRGPDGSMMTATEGLYEERKSVFKTFALGLSFTVGSLLICVWLLLQWEAAIICWLIALYTSRRIYVNYHRVSQRFHFNESDTVDFTDIFQGPAAIRAVPAAMNHVMFWNNNNNSTTTTTTNSNKKKKTTKRSTSMNGMDERRQEQQQSEQQQQQSSEQPLLNNRKTRKSSCSSSFLNRRGGGGGGGSDNDLEYNNNDHHDHDDNDDEEYMDEDEFDLEQQQQQQLGTLQTRPNSGRTQSIFSVKQRRNGGGS